MIYHVENSPDDLIPYWDYEAPGIPGEPRDTSTAALVAYGLLSIDSTAGSNAHEHVRVAELRSIGRETLDSLVENYMVLDPDDDRRGMVLHGCYNEPGGYATDNELIWTNYYVAYALANCLVN